MPGRLAAPGSSPTGWSAESPLPAATFPGDQRQSGSLEAPGPAHGDGPECLETAVPIQGDSGGFVQPPELLHGVSL